MPVRAIPKSYTHITGIVSSKKAVGEAGFESGLERDYFWLLDFDPEVERFEVQPVQIWWEDSVDKRHRYTPDCRVHFRNTDKKELLVEVKSRDSLRAKWTGVRPAFRAAVHHARLEGSHFIILTEKEIRTQYFENVRFLLPAVRHGAEESHRRAVLAAIRDLQETTPQGILSHISTDPLDRAYLLHALWGLVGTFQVCADLAEPIKMDTRLRLP